MGTDKSGMDLLIPLIDEYKSVLSARKRTAQHVADTGFRIRRVIEAAKITLVCELLESPIQRALGTMLNHNGRRPLALGSRHHHWRAIKGFSRWLSGNRGVLVKDPLISLVGYSPDLEPVHTRHIWTAGELAILIASTMTAPVHNGLCGPRRAYMYRFLVESTLRPGTVGKLTRANVKIPAGGGAHVMIRAIANKSRKPKAHPLRDDTVQWLGEYLKEFPGEPGDLLFRMPPPQRQSLILRKDLKKAGLPAVDAEGGRYDVYSFRHTALTHLALSGVLMPVLQSIAGHSTMALTAKYYVHIVPSHVTEAINAAPAIFKLAS